MNPELILEVRALIPDTSEPYMFTDQEIERYLHLNDNDPRKAALDAVDSLITEMAMRGDFSRVRTDDLQVDEESTLKWFMAKFQRMKDDVASAASDAFVMVYPIREPYCNPEATPWPTFR